MKKFALAAAFAGAASTAFAGNMAAPVIEMAPMVVIEETAGSSSSAGLIIPLILLALVAAAVAAD
ncbi:MAG: ferrochelatase [Octadecabacter sp.]